MLFEVKINNRLAKVEVLKLEGSQASIKIDEKLYELDVEKVGEGEFSIIHQNLSHNIELVRGENIKKYIINTNNKSHNVEIIDSESKYKASRLKSVDDDAEGSIIAPIPGKVVKIPVKPGDKVKTGKTLIIFSAMKMESEFKSKKDGIVKEILVKEGDVVEANKVMIVLG